MSNNIHTLKIGIAGDGAWGSALYKVLSSKYSNSVLYSYNADNIHDLKDVDYLLIVIPTQAIREFCNRLKTIIPNHTKIVICSKGIENTSGTLLHKVVENTLPGRDILYLAGPNFAEEVANDKFSVSSIACVNLSIAQEASQNLSHSNFKLYPIDDIISVALSGALKNVLAILCGIARGLELGENAIAALITKGMQEISSLSFDMGGNFSTVLSPAFVGDIFLTCNSVTSRNTQFGINLTNKFLDHNFAEIIAVQKITVEGMHTSKSLHDHYKSYKLPLLHFVYDTITQKFSNKNELSTFVMEALLQY